MFHAKQFHKTRNKKNTENEMVDYNNNLDIGTDC